MSTETSDLSAFTVEQLQEALQKKGVKPASGSAETVQPTQIKRCSFTPTRANQPACQDESSVSYGPHAYCKKHCRTVQALNAKKAWEESVKSVPVLAEEIKTEAPVVTIVDTPPEPVTKAPVEPPRPVVIEDEPEPVTQTDTDALSTPVPEEPSSKRSKATTVEPPLEEKESPPKEKEISKKQIKEDKLETRTIIKKKITPNKWGRFEEPDTGIVFDPSTKSAFAVQDHKTGKLLPLTQEQIAICKKYQWKYQIIKVEDEDEEEICETCENVAEECTCGLKPEEEEEQEEDEEQDEEEEQEEDENDEEDSDNDASEASEDNEDEEEESNEEEEESEEEEEEERPKKIPYSYGRRR
jgi:hypothetical protein